MSSATKAPGAEGPGDWALVPRLLTERMRDVLHDRVVIRCHIEERSASIMNDQAWWEAVLASAPAPSDPAGAGGDPGEPNDEAKRVMDAAWPEYGGNNQSAEFWQAFDEAVGFTLKLIRSGQLVASTPGQKGAGEEKTGASFGPGSCPLGDAPDGSSSQATAIPRAVYVVMGTTGEYSDRNEWPVCAFFSQADAQAHVKKASEWLEQHYDNNSPDFDRWDWGKNNKNPYDEGMEVDYTGTSWYVYEVPFALGTEAEGQDAESGLVHEGPAPQGATPKHPSESPSTKEASDA